MWIIWIVLSVYGSIYDKDICFIGRVLLAFHIKDHDVTPTFKLFGRNIQYTVLYIVYQS